MVLLSSPICELGKKMPEFNLRDLDNKFFNSKKLDNYNAILIFFICNHCPYVKAIIKKLVSTSNELQNYNVISIAIMPNDTIKYPEDNFENMKQFSELHNFSFPYLLDDQQKVAKKFKAVCTPDFFGFNKNKELQYRGRFFEMKNLEIINNKNYLLEAMQLIVKTGNGPDKQFPSAGCSIKWKS
ncbi:MAG: thioredoxin family protein [Alphaproteobacteria bacterium]|nr:thioredoxin family protein [Alphaproteobacteria bacterium]|tara:strand:- start:230 stop:781 length:552 start_codon:yes stop_codon:yes gene_type:complete